MKKIVFGFTVGIAGLVGMLSVAGVAAGTGGAVEQSARGLIQRVVPQAAAKFVVEQIPAADGYDVFEVDARGGKVVLRGNKGVAIAAALNYYLKKYARCEISWNCGSQLALPDRLPLPTREERVVSPMKYRFAYNYCTHGYTMAWWDWPDWERELDFMAMQGVNLALIIEGQEQVWIDALKTFGYSDAEVRKWLCMPTHQPWQYMSNMENYGGPVPASLVKRRVELGRRIIARMRAFGMDPVQQGYYGIVPSDFKKRFPDANVHPQGRWGSQKRPDMLDPMDPLFNKFATAFYTAQKKLYGNATFFAADPFHEGGSTKGIDLPSCARAIFKPMQAAAPGSTWVLQSWGANPRQPMLNALPKQQLLVLDLFCEYKENWHRRNQFGHTPWLWCTIHNFGGNTGLSANFEAIVKRPMKALAEAGPGKGQMRGIGALMEGSQTNPMLWEMFFEQGWRRQSPAVDKWIRDYGRRRYGASNSAAVAALGILLKTAYSVPGGHGQFPHNSVVCARPSLNRDQRARAFTSTRAPYDTVEFTKAWRDLLQAAPACGASDAYRYDVVDFGRQVLGDLGTRYHYAICNAWQARDRKALDKYSKKMLNLIAMMDRLTGTRREFLFGVWQSDARKWGLTKHERDLCEWNARALLTTWTVPQCWLDYANREWNGLLKGFYYHRWDMWLAALAKGADNGWKIDVNGERARIRDWEYKWTRQHETYPAEPSGDEIEIAREAFREFGADALNPEIGRRGDMVARTNLKPADFVGRWNYRVGGKSYTREFLPDGKLKLYVNGEPYANWKGYTWRMKGNQVELRKSNGAVFGKQAISKDGKLLFIGEQWGPATRQP